MQRHREQRPAIRPHVAAMQVNILGGRGKSRVIRIQRRDHEHRERPRIQVSRTRGDGFRGSRELVRQALGNLDARLRGLAQGPCRLARHEVVPLGAAGPVGKPPVIQERSRDLPDALVEDRLVFVQPPLGPWQEVHQVCKERVTQELARDLLEAAVRVIEDGRDSGDRREPGRSGKREPSIGRVRESSRPASKPPRKSPAALNAPATVSCRTIVGGLTDES